jgi:hypothetical protein
MNYISLTPAITAYINIPGYMMDKTTNVYLRLSGQATYTGTPVTLSDFTTSHKVSAIFPTITAYSYPHFTNLDKNHVVVSLYGLSGTGNADIIVYGQAGYTQLSNSSYLVQILSSR